MKQWRVFITPAAERVAKRLPNDVREFVLREFPNLVKRDPFAGTQLSGPLSWLHSFHVSIDGKPYRVAYEIDVKTERIIIHYADYRGGFYAKLLRNIQ